MKISDLSVKRPITILMMVFIVLTMGFVAFSRLQIDLFPNIEIPIAIVSTQYENVGPQEIETLITRPIEQSLSTVSNVKSIRSISSEGNSIVVVEFNFGVDMDFATLEMREKVDLVKRFLPDDTGNPIVMKIDPNALPILQIAFTDGKDLSQLQTFIEDKVQSRLERIDGVASVNISGGYVEEIQIKVSQEIINGYGISLSQIANALRSENLNLPGGEIYIGDRKLLIKTAGEFNHIDEIRNLPILLPSGGVVSLGNIAEVELTTKDITSITKMNGIPAINMSIQKESDANTVIVARRVIQEIESIRKEFPNLNIDIVQDQSQYIMQAIRNVAKNGFLGGMLAIVILYLFLRNIRSTFIIATAIPISIIATFTLLYYTGITINLMTLGGLALGIGMLVDNSIVVLENIFRFREEGYSRIESARLGAAEVGMAVLASTLTTIAVFLPISFTEGITSSLFKELALTVTFSLLSSLIVSLTLVPMLSSKLLKIEKKHQKRKFSILTKIFDRFETFFEKLTSLYSKILNAAIHHTKTTVAIALAIFLVTISLIPFIGAEFIPAMDEGYITVEVELPNGSSLMDTNHIITTIEEKINTIPEIIMVNSSIGGGNRFSMGQSSREHRGSMDITLVDSSSRNRTSAEVADEIRSLTRDIAGAKIEVTAFSSTMGMGLSGGSAPISIEIRGDSLEELKKISDDFVRIISGIEGTREVKSGFEEGTPEIQIILDRNIASRYGLTAGQVATAVRASISGTVATRYKLGGTEIDVRVMGDESTKHSISNIEQLFIATPVGVSIPLGHIANLEIVKGPSSINRTNQVRTVTVTSHITGRDLASVTKDIDLELKEYSMPSGYDYRFGGERQQMIEAFQDLALALLLAVLLVYMVLASQFESLINPFIIMLSVPLAISGGALALFITRRTISVPSIIGVIILAGIVVNNAIVLIDYMNTLRSKGLERNEAILKAGPTRLRPILMTTFTTVLGLIPLSIGIGDGAEFQAPMATVVIGGLILSTLLTLVFIPVIYIIFDNMTNRIKNKIFNRTSSNNSI